MEKEKKYVQSLEGTNRINSECKNISNGEKILLILEKDLFESVDRQLINNKQESKVDMAVLGFTKGIGIK